MNYPQPRWALLALLCTASFAQSFADAPPVLLYLPGLHRQVSEYRSIAEGLRQAGYEVQGVTPRRNQAVADQESWVEDLLEAKRNLPKGRRVGVWGHSLGGAAAWAAAAKDADILAAANLDGDLMDRFRELRPTQALLLLSNGSSLPSTASVLERHGWERSEARRSADWRAVAASARFRLRVRISHAGHMSFSDLALQSPRDEKRFGTADPRQVHAKSIALLRAFFDEHLRGQRGACEKALAASGEIPLP